MGAKEAHEQVKAFERGLIGGGAIFLAVGVVVIILVALIVGSQGPIVAPGTGEGKLISDTEGA